MRQAAAFDGVMRLAFCVDGYRNQAGAAVRQDANGVHAWIQGDFEMDVVRAQVARMLSLDHDGREFMAVGHRDPVVGRLQAVAPGLRPPLFYSPYEAAAWAVLSARRPAAQMAALRRRLSEAHGRSFDIAGERLAAFPTPEELLALASFDGLPEIKLRRLHGIARAALAGRLDASRLAAMEPDDAMTELRGLDGIGPFYSALVVVRATGLTDVLATQEPKFKALVTELYGLSAIPDLDQLTAIAEPWRPFRTWVTVLIRAAAHRL